MQLISQPDMYRTLMSVLADPLSSISEAVSDILLQAAGPDGSRFFSSYDEIAQVANSQGTVLIRVLTLAARVGALSPAAFETYRYSGLLHATVKLVQSENDDILLRMSAFEVLNEIAKSSLGLTYLTNEAHLASLFFQFAPPGPDVFLTTGALGTIQDIVDRSIQHNDFAWMENGDVKCLLER